MDLLTYIIGTGALISIFLFSIHKFSRQIQRVAGDSLRRALHSMTSTTLRGTFIGVIVTSLIQSSTATTVLTVGLVNAGLITFYQSLGVIFGSNIGSAVFSQLLVFRVTDIAPYIVLIGAVMMYFGKAFGWGKVFFYFGMTFFSITLISTYVDPLAQDPRIIQIFSHLGDNLWLAILAGALFTVIVQSSAVTSGLILSLSALSVITFPMAIGMILGANIGTTATALIASINMSEGAKKAGIAHFLFNIIGTALILPVLTPFMEIVMSFGGDMPQQIANAHMIFNIISVVIAIILVKPFAWLVEFVYRLLPKKS